MVLLGATVIDRIVGDPDWLWRRVPHPVAGFGALIAVADRSFNRPEWSDKARRVAGVAAILGLTMLSVFLGLLLSNLFAAWGPIGLGLEAVVASVFLAQKSLRDHVEAVARALRTGGLVAGRRAVSMIVGRDPDQLDEPAVCRAAIESLAENASDGVVAPWLALLLFGLPGLLAYKMINTADSMIGHRSERYRAFGWGAARLDDLANLAPARLTALLFALAAALRLGAIKGQTSWRIARRDARLHRSPNAGWPESAMAGALDLALGGPRRYGALDVDAPLLHVEGRRKAVGADIAGALNLFAVLCNVLLLVAMIAVFA